MLRVPNHMTYADFCQFCGSFIHHILEMRIVRFEFGNQSKVISCFVVLFNVCVVEFHLCFVGSSCLRFRNDGMEDRYSILIRFDGQDSTDNFYRHFNGRRFSSLEVWFAINKYLIFKFLVTLRIMYSFAQMIG